MATAAIEDIARGTIANIEGFATIDEQEVSAASM